MKKAVIGKKRKRSKGKNELTNDILGKKSSDSNSLTQITHMENTDSPKTNKKSKSNVGIEQYPILKDEQLIQKFHSVTLTNNQKGRIRQLLRDNLKGTSENLLPDVIHNRMQAILKSTDQLSDSDLRKLRILHNMLKTAIQSNNTQTEKVTDKSKKDSKKNKKQKLENNKDGKEETENNLEEKESKKDAKKEVVTKVKGPKRYVVFVGNLPLGINREKIIEHFSELKDSIKDVRIPKQSEGKKSAIAYVELANEITYELALSKHHSMLENKRVNVLYTAQKKGKISKTEAKSKTAKLVALQKSGKLIGSVPMNRKRSHRRMKMKQAQAKLAAGSA
ncbi:unnamed protein product [Parnassius apollo]|uniref:(apollo) hypothetical protein n=1 Tax=Parnassius apollo TaxID=110799 RepID=A0A8S3WGV3_PARAO|nr:unnamed protein product [Parnassius apollo]